MLASLSRELKLALVLMLGVGFVAWDGHRQAVYAADDEEEDDDGGGDDDAGSGEEEETEEEDPKEQPAVTSGGLYTLRTFPVRELDRPLTITQQITQVRAGVGTDVSALGAFESFGVNLEAVHGLKDNFMLLGGVTSAYNFGQFAAYAGFEGALSYDFLDFRAAARLSRGAAVVADEMGNPTIVEGDITGGVDIGFPFRYVAKPEIAIIALNTLMSIDFDSKPDLNPSVGIATNPVPPLSVVVFATLKIVDFNTDADAIQVPATARVQFSPNQKFDIGGEFTFLNLKPPAGEFYDNRFLTLFFAMRVGK